MSVIMKMLKVLLFLKKYFIYLFLDRGEGGRKRQKHQCVVASHVHPIGDLARN